MITACIYARYSTDNQDSRSIDDQIRRCREYAERCGYRVADEYNDAAISGTHTARAQLQKMITKATSKARPYRVVIVDDLSRLSRDIGDTHAIVFGQLAAAGVKVADTSGLDSESDSGEMTIAMRSIINREFIRGVSKMTHRGLTGRALGGFSTGGRKYGYTSVVESNPPDPANPRKIWRVLDEEAAVVRRIYEMRLGGWGFRLIASTLNDERVPSPRGETWTHVTVRKILTSPVYAGQLAWNRNKYVGTPSGTKKPLARPENEHVVRDVPELAIVDRTMWDRVQRLVATRGRGCRRGQSVYLLSGLLRCGTCGGPMTLRSANYTANTRHVRYGCANRAGKGTSVCTNGSTLAEHHASAAMVDALRELLSTEQARDAFVRGFERRVRQSRTKASAADIESKLVAARKRLQNATRLLVEMPDDIEIRAQRDADKAEVAHLESELAERPTAIKLPDPKVIRAAINKLVAQMLTDAEQGNAVLSRCLGTLRAEPLPAPRHANARTVGARYRLTGSLDVGGLLASQRVGRSRRRR